MPYEGGLFDQPYEAILRLEKVKLADQIVEEAEEKKENAKAEAEKRVEQKYGTKVP